MLPLIPGMALQIQFNFYRQSLLKRLVRHREASYMILFSLGGVGYGSGACIPALFISSWLCLVELRFLWSLYQFFAITACRHMHGRNRW